MRRAISRSFQTSLAPMVAERSFGGSETGVVAAKVIRTSWVADAVDRSRQRIATNAAVKEEVAERVGFEPTVEFPQHTLSKRAP